MGSGPTLPAWWDAKVWATLIDRDAARLDRQLRRLERRLPVWAARRLRWLSQPSSRWVRLPAGALLVLGGLLSILPFLGIWMAPLGLLLLAQDLPVLRRPTGRSMIWTERRWTTWSRRRGRS